MSERSGECQDAAPLTLNMLNKAFERIRDEERIPHGTAENPHVVHPDSRTKDGWYICTCGPIPVRNGQVDWEWGASHIAKGAGS